MGNALGLILLGLLALSGLWLLIDFGVFAVKTNRAKVQKNGVKVDAGGILLIEGRRTYYAMPNGVRRKIADYPMDPTPGSVDMNAFLAVMDKAKKANELEKLAKRKEAFKAMNEVAREEAQS